MPPKIHKETRPEQGGKPPTKKQRIEIHPPERDASIENLIGFDENDLPISMPPPNNTIKYYEGKSVARTLDWKANSNGEPIRRELKNSVSLIAAFMQTRGQQASEPCDFCRKGAGIWKTCVVDMDLNEDNSIHGTCANCRFSRRVDCCHRVAEANTPKDTQLKKNESEESFRPTRCPNSSYSSSEAGELQEHIAVEEFGPLFGLGPIIGTPRLTANSQRVQEHRSPFNSPGNEILAQRALRQFQEYAKKPGLSVNQSLSNDTSLKKEHSAQDPGYDVTSSSSKSSSESRLDGKILNFPLGPEAFDNLPLLKQAIKDTTSHLSAMKRRASQLEEREERRKSINPWDMI